MFQLFRIFLLLFGIMTIIEGGDSSSSVSSVQAPPTFVVALNEIEDGGEGMNLFEELTFLLKEEIKKKHSNHLAKVQSLIMNGSHSIVNLDDGRTLLVKSPKIGVTFQDRNFTKSEAIIPPCPFIEPKPLPQDIPNTNLQTRTNYKLRLKRFPLGILTWTYKSNETYSFVQVDLDPTHLPKYELNMDWYHDTHWQFIPVLHQGNETGWYGLRNNGLRGAYLKWTWDNLINDHAHYMVLDRDYPGENKKGDFFLKPVKVELEGGEIYYQIKLKNLPRGVVTWSETKYGEGGSHYIQADVSTYPEHYDKYNVGGEWYEDTLFKFEEVKEERKLVKMEVEEIGDLERE